MLRDADRPSATELEEMLRRTLDDRRLSRAEKKVLAEIFETLELDDDKRALWRHTALTVARRQLPDPRAAAVLEWFADVSKLLVSPPARETVAEAHFSPGDDCVRRIIGLFQSARRCVDVCVFTITDDRIARAIHAAHQRGVGVRIVTDDEKTLDRGSDIEALNTAGIPVRVDNSPAHMHHKFAVFDRTLLLSGSFNWTRSASAENQENIIVTSEPRLVRRFSDTFELLWNTFG
jgi:phosphatidylserine/phosphatidylglycerophosphate/cardiolipin synthase-like enzyme